MQELLNQAAAFEIAIAEAATREAALEARMGAAAASADAEVQRLTARLAAVEADLSDECTAHVAAVTEAERLDAKVVDLANQLAALAAEHAADQVCLP